MRFFILSLLCLFAVLPQKADAHFYQENNSVAALLHINPQDDPIIGQPADLQFVFQKSQNLEHYAITLNIAIDGNAILSHAVTAQGSIVFYNFTFPKKGIYQISLTGSNNQTQTFNLVYDLRVDRETQDRSIGRIIARSEHGLHFVVLGVGILAGLIIYFQDKFKKIKSPIHAKE